MCARKLLIAFAFGLIAWDALADTQTRTSAFEYDLATGLLKKEIVEPDDPNLCLVTTYEYGDTFGNRTSATTRNCNASSSEAAAPAAGSPAIITLRTSITSFAATAANPVAGQFATSIKNALSHEEKREYDARFGAVTNLTGPNLLTTTWTYDSFGRKKEERRADGTVTTWTYTLCTAGACPVNGAYYVTAVSTGAPTSSTYYDGLNRELRSETQGFEGIFIRKDTEYDTRGRVAQVSRPYQVGQTTYWTRFTYDDLNRVITATEPTTSSGTLITTNSYNGLTTSVSVNSSPVQTKTTLKNGQGQVATVTDPQGNTVNYSYDPFGNVLQTNAAGVLTTLVYDLRGRKISMNDPDMGAWSYAYDVLGELVRQTDAKGQLSTMTYDVLGRMVRRLEPDLDSTWTYDSCTKGIGKLCSVSSTNGYARSYTYDSLSRPITLSATIDTAYSVTTAYVSSGPHAGKVDTLTYPTGFGVRNTYNAYGYPLEVRVANPSANPAFAADGTLLWHANAPQWQANTQAVLVQSETLGNGVGQTRKFDVLGRLSEVSAGAIFSHSYSYDVLGNLKTRTDNVQTVNESFDYDILNRLWTTTGTNASGYLVTRGFDYDPRGNLIYKSDVGTLNYPAAGSVRPHAVSSVSVNGTVTASYNYDANGNLLSGAGRTLNYKSFNMPDRIVGTAATYIYTYSPEHQRVRLETQLSTGTQTSIYLHPGGGGALFYEKEIKLGGTLEHKHYVQAGAGLVGVYVTQSSYAPGEGPGMRYYHRDHLGSVVAISNEAGARIETLAYEAFGKRRRPDGTADPNNLIFGMFTDRGFTAHEHLDELGLVHMNGRVYDPLLGRFMTPDPLIQAPGNLQSYNHYSYVWNNPLNGTDPSGYSRWTRFRDKATHALSKPAVAFAIQQLDPMLGTYLLTRSEAGKKVLAGEIVVGTAVATWYCGGCGVGVGALLGEASGGYSAYRAGGDILKGVAVGGAVGAATAYVAGGINTETGSFWEQVAKNAGAGAIRGMGTGAASGYAGGKGDFDTIVRGMETGAAVGGAMGAGKVLVFGANITSSVAVQADIANASDFYGSKFNDVVVRQGGLIQGIGAHDAITIGNYINIDSGIDPSSVLPEELYHVTQWNSLGYAGFTSTYMSEWASGGFNYNNIVLEMQAKEWAATYRILYP